MHTAMKLWIKIMKTIQLHGISVSLSIVFFGISLFFAKKKIGAAVPSVNLISLNYFLIMNLMRKKTDIHIKSIADFVVSWNCTYEVNGEKSDCD